MNFPLRLKINDYIYNICGSGGKHKNVRLSVATHFVLGEQAHFTNLNEISCIVTDEARNLILSGYDFLEGGMGTLRVERWSAD